MTVEVVVFGPRALRARRRISLALLAASPGRPDDWAIVHPLRDATALVRQIGSSRV